MIRLYWFRSDNCCIFLIFSTKLIAKCIIFCWNLQSTTFPLDKRWRRSTFFSYCLFFQILGHFLWFAKAETWFIWLCINFWVKSSIFQAPYCTSLLTAKVPPFFPKLKKGARGLRVEKCRCNKNPWLKVLPAVRSCCRWNLREQHLKENCRVITILLNYFSLNPFCNHAEVQSVWGKDCSLLMLL